LNGPKIPPGPKPPKETRRTFQPIPENSVFTLNDYTGWKIPQIITGLMNTYAQELESNRLNRNLTTDMIRENAANCFRAAMPELSDRASVLAYIACVAWALRMRVIEPSEAKTMMFMAQTQLTALKTPNNPTGDPAAKPRAPTPPEPTLFALPPKPRKDPT